MKTSSVSPTLRRFLARLAGRISAISPSGSPPASWLSSWPSPTSSIWAGTQRAIRTKVQKRREYLSFNPFSHFNAENPEIKINGYIKERLKRRLKSPFQKAEHLLFRVLLRLQSAYMGDRHWLNVVLEASPARP